ncbi:hypothetical protein MtrunA17_Chr4g0070751 [Medicago truncatula]|uniref:Transmembrane protein n=1 Tax=Medicago truncatula TaxID=3880 RepID=A0A396IL58_MEDTR|nr:hypothetical protein MtrunA17_Chr4g0070751 [Medicago truncatula]
MFNHRRRRVSSRVHLFICRRLRFFFFFFFFHYVFWALALFINISCFVKEILILKKFPFDFVGVSDEMMLVMKVVVYVQ